MVGGVVYCSTEFRLLIDVVVYCKDIFYFEMCIFIIEVFFLFWLVEPTFWLVFIA